MKPEKTTKQIDLEQYELKALPPQEKDARAILQHWGVGALKSAFGNSYAYDPKEDSDQPKPRTETEESKKSSVSDEDAIVVKFCYDGRTFHMELENDYVPLDRRSVECHMRELEVEEAYHLINRIQRERFVRYVGSYAGKSKGFHTEDGVQFLVTSGPRIIEPAEGRWDTLRAVINAILGDDLEVDDRQVQIFLLWLKIAYEALTKGVRMPGQAMVLAGPPECGKSLLIEVIVRVLGGRRGHPHKYITGRTHFNGELLGCEVLVSDDDSGSTDFKTRRGVGAAYKNLLFAGEVPIEAKFGMPRSCAPFWRLVIAANNEPESLLVLPVLSADIADKINLLLCHKRPLPMASDSPEGRKQFMEKLVSEIPAMLFELLEMTVPEDLRSDRCAVTFFHHPALLASLSELSPENTLLQLIDEALPMNPKYGGFTHPWEGTVAELRRELFDFCHVKGDVERVASSMSLMGSFLGRLSNKGTRVERLKYINGIKRWRIHPLVSPQDLIREHQLRVKAAKAEAVIQDAESPEVEDFLNRE